MIPLTLSLKNFLSYGSELQTINFTPYSFICLSGKNGHGKSALLDAMTWAMWGQARKIAGASRADESLLRLSQKHMIVVFEFISNETHYRIKREFYKSPNKSNVTLDFGFINASNHCVPLTTKTIKDTQQLIIKTIGLDFDTFVNSSFLKQGGSNEFSKKSPKERKDIIGNILSLDQYEHIKRRASEKVRALTTEIACIRITQEKKLVELMEYENVPHLFDTVIQELTSLQQNEFYIKNTILSLEHTINEIRSNIMQLNAQHSIEQEQIRTYETLKNQLYSLRTQWKQILYKKIQRGCKEVLEQKQQQLQQNIKKQQEFLDAKLKVTSEITDLEHKKRAIVTQITEERFTIQNNYTAQKEALLAEKKILETNIQKIIVLEKKEHEKTEKYNQELIIVNQEKEKGSAQEKVILFYTRRFEKRKEIYQKINILHNQYTNQLHELEAKEILFNNEDPSCPLCETPLDINKKNQCIASIIQEKTIILHNINRIELLKKRLEKELQTYDDFKKKVTLHVQHHESIILKQNQLELKIQQTAAQQTNYQEEIQYIHQNLNTINNQIKKSEEIFLQQITKYNHNEDLQLLEEKIKHTQHILHQNMYNELLHTKMQEDLKILERSLYIDYASLDGRLLTLKEQIINLCSFMKNKKIQPSSKPLLHTITHLEIEEKKYIQQMKEKKENLIVCAEKKELLLQKRGTLEAQNKQRESIQKIMHDEELHLKKLQKSLEEYTLIVQATGKDGIQALIIEQSIPEIEYEANALLSRLSNNQMHIIIESLKDLKSGKTKETLDIKISDAEGVRSYELFSGGEAFRIDLSLRIAISKLLASRAGTTLQTLIIDEGFGSQDEEGTAHIIDALYKIQEDFQKIIVVSHLNSIKEQIPVHFMVQKTAMGSSVQIIEQ